MFCSKCGSKLEEGAQFCSKCGTAVAAAADKTVRIDADKTVVIDADKTTVIDAADKTVAFQDATVILDGEKGYTSEIPTAEPYGETGDMAFEPEEGNFAPTSQFEPVEPQAEEPQSGGKSKMPLIIGIIVVVLIAAAAIGYFVLNGAPKQTGTSVQVKFQINAPGFDSNDSKLPITVTGTTSGGSKISEDFFLDPGGNGAELAPGKYTAAVKTSPLLDDAKIYTVPTTTYSFEIPSTVQDGSTFTVTNSTISLSYAPLAEVTDAQINDAYDMAITSGFDKSKADAYKTALKLSRDNAAAAAKAAADQAAADAKKKAEEDAKKKQEEEEAAKAITWYMAPAKTPKSSTESGVYSMTVVNNIMTVDASFKEAASYEGIAKVTTIDARKTYSFTVTSDTKYYSTGGTSSPQEITVDQVVQSVTSQSGLGLYISVRGDKVLEVRLAS